MATSNTKQKKNGQVASKEQAQQVLERELIANVLLSRSSLMKNILDPRRSINADCGYPLTDEITSEDYRELYDREPIAARVVQVLPYETWQSPPTVFETEDVDQTTPFESAWQDLAQGLFTESWFRGDEGNPIWEHLLRADVLSGIGSYGVLLLGLDDGVDLREPVKPNEGRKLLFLRSFDESLTDISLYETDPANPRFGKPLMYRVQVSEPRDNAQSSIGMPMATLDVHWSRIIHLADSLGSSEIIGVPRMRPVYNRLLDLRKLYGGSAEMYWRGAFPGFSVQSHPQLGPDVSFNLPDTKDQMENYMNSLQRYLALSGVDIKSLAPQVVDPTPQIDTQIDSICIQKGIPKRIFTGSERGELASSQDKRTWNGRLKFRQNTYVTPRIIVPFLDRLISLGVLPTPQEYSVIWPDLDSLSLSERAAVAVQQTDALAKYVQGGVEAMMLPVDFLVSILGLPEEEATSILDSAVASEESIFGNDDEEEEEEKSFGEESGDEKETEEEA